MRWNSSLIHCFTIVVDSDSWQPTTSAPTSSQR